MSDQELPTGECKRHALADADISSQRRVSRRSVLGSLGIGAGAACAAVLGAVTPARAGDPARCYRDSDRLSKGSRGDTARTYCDDDVVFD